MKDKLEEQNLSNEDMYTPVPMVEGEDLEIYDEIYTDLFGVQA